MSFHANLEYAKIAFKRCSIRWHGHELLLLMMMPAGGTAAIQMLKRRPDLVGHKRN